MRGQRRRDTDKALFVRAETQRHRDTETQRHGKRRTQRHGDTYKALLVRVETKERGEKRFLCHTEV